MEILKRGSKGEEVRLWQEFLQSLGHDATPDGDFGQKTHVATRNFQLRFMEAGDADGIVGPKTIARAKEKGFAGFSPSNEEPKSATANPRSKKILVSAGHSTVLPRDPGAVGNGFTEAYLALELRDLVADLLREKGCVVIEDGEDGQNQPLKKAIDLVRNQKPAAAVEFHWNAGPPSATGIEVLAKPDKKRLAQQLAQAISGVTNLEPRGEDGWKPDNSGQHHRLGFCEAGGLIIETCFLTSRVDMDRYTANKGRVAAAIAEVLARA